MSTKKTARRAAPPPAERAKPVVPRTRIKRIAENACYDPQEVRDVIDASFICHIAFQDAGSVHCIPTACWRIEDYLYVHGSNGSRMLRALKTGAQVCVLITHLDGLVLARSAFNHTMNYRSVAIYGSFSVLDAAEKPAALAALMEHLAPGRQAQARPGNRKELAATTVLRVPLAESVAKIRRGAPIDDQPDMDWPVWAGVLPLSLVPLEPWPDPACQLPAPEAVAQWKNRVFSSR